MGLIFAMRIWRRTSQSPDEDSLSSDKSIADYVRVYCELKESQSPDEDSLSSDRHWYWLGMVPDGASDGLNPLTRIHCLPTVNIR